MKRFLGWILAFMSVLFAGSIFVTPVMAGNRTSVMTYTDSSGVLNEKDWNRLDENVICEDGKLVIPADTSTADTKYISKSSAVADPAVKDMIDVSALLRLTALPEGEKFVLAFGLRGVEAYEGDDGNIEIIFENNNGIQTSIVVFDDGGKTELMESRKCGLSMNSEFAFDASITSEGVFTVKINGSVIYNKRLPISGEGRFGIIQTGNCGVVFSKLINSCSFYDKPENTNIYEDFEDEEFNTKELVSALSLSNGLFPVNLSVEEYNGSKVMMFRNISNAYFGTAQAYSNFELSFDVPYYLRQSVYDEDGNCIANPSRGFSIGFGEENTYPKQSNDYIYDIDLVEFGPDYVSSSLLGKYAVSTRDLGIYDVDSESDGFSVKLTVVDGHSVVQMKKLDGSNWITVAEADYENFRSGYISIWVTNNGNFAIDNFKLENKDVDPNIVEVEYNSSKFVVEDYKYTPEPLVFREDAKEEKTEKAASVLPIILVVIGIAVLVIAAIILIIVSKRRKQDGGEQYDKK